jgi:hypothetical protein
MTNPSPSDRSPGQPSTDAPAQPASPEDFRSRGDLDTDAPLSTGDTGHDLPEPSRNPDGTFRTQGDRSTLSPDDLSLSAWAISPSTPPRASMSSTSPPAAAWAW